MSIENSYSIQPEFLYMVGVYDRNAKPCSLVREPGRCFIVDKAPLAILDDSIKCIGFDLRGAMETSRWLLGNKNMCPIMINPIHNICVFPSKSAKHLDTIWFNPDHIVRTYGIKRETLIEFTDGSTLMIPSKLYHFNNKLQTAEQFRNMMNGTGNITKMVPRKRA